MLDQRGRSVNTPYVGLDVHYAIATGQCRPGVVTSVSEGGNPNILVSVEPDDVKPFCPGHFQAFCTGVLYDQDTRLPGTWHYGCVHCRG